MTVSDRQGRTRDIRQAPAFSRKGGRLFAGYLAYAIMQAVEKNESGDTPEKG